MPEQVLRHIAEAALKAQKCSPIDKKVDVPGQWWVPPWGGPQFFLQWCSDDDNYVYESQLRHILEDLARCKPLNPEKPH